MSPSSTSVGVVSGVAAPPSSVGVRGDRDRLCDGGGGPGGREAFVAFWPGAALEAVPKPFEPWE
eukprot:1001112-Pyramimonas_sp.AAC.1